MGVLAVMVVFAAVMTAAAALVVGVVVGVAAGVFWVVGRLIVGEAAAVHSGLASSSGAEGLPLVARYRGDIDRIRRAAAGGSDNRFGVGDAAASSLQRVALLDGYRRRHSGVWCLSQSAMTDIGGCRRGGRR